MEYGSTALMSACQNGCKDVAKLLLDNSAAKDIDITLTGREKLPKHMRDFIDTAMIETQQSKRRKLD